MAGRPRLYANAAEKTRAYRERQELTRTVVDLQWAEQSLKDMRRLICAVFEAQKRGDELALSLRSVTIVDMMADLALYFESGVITPRVVRVQKQPRRKQLKPEPGSMLQIPLKEGSGTLLMMASCFMRQAIHAS